MNNTKVIILAGGRGSRLPQYEKKELIPINGSTIIGNLVENVKNSKVCQKPVIVVGHKAEKIMDALGQNYLYAYQKEQLGTGHAVACAKEVLEDEIANVIVLYGDHPFVKPDTIRDMNQKFLESEAVLSLITVALPDFGGWRSMFLNYGRIVRDEANEIKAIVESKDADEEQGLITEVNPGYYCFDAKWLWKNIDSLSSNNKQGEYYLTDLVSLAFRQGQKIDTITSYDPVEGLGINTPEQLEIALRHC